MNLYKLSQDKNSGWDTYDSAVVAAESADDARLILPNGEMWNEDLYQKFKADQDNYGEHYWVRSRLGTWCHPDDVTVEFVGTTEMPAGLILASFNAG